MVYKLCISLRYALGMLFESGLNPGPLNECKITGKDTISHKVPGSNAGALTNPFVRRLHALLCQFSHKVSVRQSTGRQVTAGASDSRISSHGCCGRPPKLRCHVGQRQKRCCMGNTESYSVEQVVLGCIIRAVQSDPEGQNVCRSVALEYQAAQTQKGCSVVPTMINPIFKCF